MRTEEIEKIAELHNSISNLLGVEWGSGWWYEEHTCTRHFHWNENGHHCQSDIYGFSIEEALEHFEFLIKTKQERRKELSRYAMPPIQREEATSHDIEKMKYWFSTHADVYDKHFARTMSQGAIKKINELNDSELQQLHHRWQEYLLTKEQK